MGIGGAAPHRRGPVPDQGVLGCQRNVRNIAQGGPRRCACQSPARHYLSKARREGIRCRQGGVSHPFRPGHPPRARWRLLRRRTAPRPFRCSEATRRRDGWTIGATLPPTARSSAALRSAHLADALDAYLNAYAEDLAGYYPGVNALAMLKIQGGLAQRAPDAWEAAFDDPDKAAGALKDRDACAKRIAASLA